MLRANQGPRTPSCMQALSNAQSCMQAGRGADPAHSNVSILSPAHGKPRPLNTVLHAISVPKSMPRAACRQAEVLNQLTAVSAFSAQQGLQRKEAKDAAEREERLLATLRLDLADGLQAGILIMMATATYCALWIGFPQLQLGRQAPQTSLGLIMAVTQRMGAICSLWV